MDPVEYPPCGSNEWLAWMERTVLKVAVAMQEPPPPSPPLQAAAEKAIGHLIQIEQELRRGQEASPVVVANADRLRKIYHDRLRVLGSLHDALAANAEDDQLYEKLGAFVMPKPNPDAAPKQNPETVVHLKPSEAAQKIRQRGPAPVKFQAVFRQMQQDAKNGVDLYSMLEKEMEHLYQASRDTCRKARNQLLARSMK